MPAFSLPAGVPPLLPSGYIDFSEIYNPPLAVADDSSIANLATQPAIWGLYLNGSAVITADNVESFSFKQDYLISDYPTEGGGFETYNKVTVPYDVRIRFTAGGSDSDRQALLDSVSAAAETLDLYTALTPEATYPSVNIIHFDYRRTAENGVGLIRVDVWCQEVRVTATQTFSQVAAPSGADPQNNGNVLVATPTGPQQATLPSVM